MYFVLSAFTSNRWALLVLIVVSWNSPRFVTLFQLSVLFLLANVRLIYYSFYWCVFLPYLPLSVMGLH